MDKLKNVLKELDDVYINSKQELEYVINSLRYLKSYFKIDYKNQALWINLKENSIIIENDDLVSLYGGKYSAIYTCDLLLTNKNLCNLFNSIKFEESPFEFYSLDRWEFLKNFDFNLFKETINLMKPFEIITDSTTYEDSIEIEIRYITNNISFEARINEDMDNVQLKLLNEQLVTLIKFKTLDKLKEAH